VTAEVTAVGTDRWLSTLRRITFVPSAHREFDTGPDTALAMLRCPPQVLDALVAAGLPAIGTGPDRRFCRYDLFNLALYSGTGTTLPEIGFEFALRFARQPVSTWTEPRRWRMAATLSCPDGRCGADPAWILHRPAPELTGGAASGWASPHGTVTVTDQEVHPPGVPDLVAVHLDVTTAGKPGRIVSTRLARLFDTVLNGGLRWHLLPAAWQVEPDDVLGQGVVNCIAASLYLERECREMGYESYARRGWLIGLIDLDHAWLEVRDDDGRVKTVDPVMALLARLIPGHHEEFVAFCLGSALNRVLPCACRAEGPMALHSCAGRSRPAELTSAIRPQRGTVTDRETERA
jgi:hypothetical protein